MSLTADDWDKLAPVFDENIDELVTPRDRSLAFVMESHKGYMSVRGMIECALVAQRLLDGAALSKGNEK